MLLTLAAPLVFLWPRDSYGLSIDRPAPGFELRDVSGQAVSLADFRGRYLFLMFGYLNCPRVCHTQALTFEEVALISGDDTPLTFGYIAIDPERDMPSAVAAYFDSRGDDFVSLHGEDVALLQALAGEYRFFFSASPGRGREYEIDHSALYYLIDPEGRLRFTYAASQNLVPRIIEDLERLKSSLY